MPCRLLLHAVDGRQQLARGVGAVPHRRRVQQVVVAVAAGRAASPVAQHPHAAAVHRFGQREQGVSLPASPAEVVAGGTFVDHAALVHHVLQAIRHPGVGQAVAALRGRSPGSSLDVLGMSRWATKRTSGLSMPMPTQWWPSSTPSSRWKRSWFSWRTASSPRGRAARDALRHSASALLLHPLARLAVDDAGVARVLALDKAQQLRASGRFFSTMACSGCWAGQSC